MRHGIDPMAGLRGHYSTALGAARIVRAAGGFRDLCRVQATRVGLVDGDGPGAIGIVEHADFKVIGGMLAYCYGPGLWMGKSFGGGETLRPELVTAAWQTR